MGAVELQRRLQLLHTHVGPGWGERGERHMGSACRGEQHGTTQTLMPPVLPSGGQGSRDQMVRKSTKKEPVHPGDIIPRSVMSYLVSIKIFT